MRDTYWRRARVVRVIDGDTIQLIVDLGFYTYAEHRMRLLGVDTPEMHAPLPEVRASALAAATFTTEWLRDHTLHATDPDWRFNIRTEKADSFGRFLAYLECAQGHSLNDDLLSTGHARPYAR
jgi:micrococcal nuclease